MTTLTVYGATVSPFVRKVRVVLAEKALEYKLEPINIFAPPPWFADISPLKRIPVLKDAQHGDDAYINDSSVICQYLNEQYPDNSLYPDAALDKAKALWYEEYSDSEMAAAIGLGIFRPVVVNQLLGKPADVEGAKAAISEKLPRFFDYLNAELSGKTYLVGDALSIADISVATHFVNAKHAGYSLDAARWPELARFVEAMHERDSFQQVIKDEAMFHKPVDLS